MLTRLRTYGSVIPAGLTLAHLRAWLLGIRDGWNLPHDVSTSFNVDDAVTRHAPSDWGIGKAVPSSTVGTQSTADDTIDWRRDADPVHQGWVITTDCVQDPTDETRCSTHDTWHNQIGRAGS